MIPFKRLVFCGGGTRCLVFLRTLVELENAKHLVNVQEYWGTSAGALIASLFALSKSAKKTREKMLSADYLKFRDIDISNLFGIQTTWGLDDGKSLVKEIERLFDSVEPGSQHKCMTDISGLNIVCADLNIHETIVCNSTTFPNLRVVDAIRASMSLPLIFKPYIHESGHYWVDGAIRENFPWDVLPGDTARSESLGFAFEKKWSNGPNTFSDYMFSMLHFDEPKKIRRHKQCWPKNIIWYKPPPFPPWFIRLKEDDYKMIDSIGEKAFQDWITLHSSVGTIQNCPSSVRPSVLPQGFPLDHTVESSGTLPPFREPSLGSSLLQSPNTSPSCRRWSV